MADKISYHNTEQKNQQTKFPQIVRVKSAKLSPVNQTDQELVGQINKEQVAA